jgi:hypothetical protein
MNSGPFSLDLGMSGIFSHLRPSPIAQTEGDRDRRREQNQVDSNCQPPSAFLHKLRDVTVLSKAQSRSVVDGKIDVSAKINCSSESQ